VIVAGLVVDREKLWFNTQKAANRVASVTPAGQSGQIYSGITGARGQLLLKSVLGDQGTITHVFTAKRNDIGAAFLRLDAPRGSILASFEVEAIESVLATSAYLPVIRRFPSGEYLLGATVQILPLRPEVTLTANVSGYGTIFAGNGLASIDIVGSDFAENGFLNLYLVAPSSFNPDTMSLRFDISPKETNQ
jgi:hypothetical protein